MSEITRNLIKLGAANPELRPHIRPLLKRIAGKGETWHKRLMALQAEFVKEVVAEAAALAKDEGADKVTVNANTVSGIYKGGKFTVYYDIATDKYATMKVQWTWDVKPPVRNAFSLRMEAPFNVAAESLYKHFNGFID